ncbi:MAG: hypothetical protein WBF58_18070 [Xanthobacteraceae bacterium]
MSDRARDFLDDWFGKHIALLPAGKRLAASVLLAAQCRVDATALGIPLQEIRDAAGGDLIRKILQVLDFVGALQDEISLVPESPALVEA